MPPYLYYTLAGAAIFCLGIGGVLLSSHLLKKIIALNLSASGVFLLLISMAQRNARPEPDPVPQAMVLTGIVVALAATAFAVTIVRRIHARTGATTLAAFSNREEEGL